MRELKRSGFQTTRFLLAFLACASGSFGQLPLIYTRHIFNAANFMPAGLPAGAIAQGSIFSIFGNNLGPSAGVSASAFPLGTSLSGVAINVIGRAATVSAIPVYVSSSQINAIMPSTAPIGAASLQVVVGNSKSNLAPVNITTSAFGIFTALGTGQGPGILQNFVSATNQPINSPTVTANPGQAITLWGTGLGPVTYADNIAPSAGNLPVKTEVFVGGISASILYSGRTPCCSGTDQIVFEVPANAPLGCWVPVYVRTGGTVVSNIVTMAITAPGDTCSTDVFPQITSAFLQGTATGAAAGLRAVTYEDLGTVAPVTVSADYYGVYGAMPTPGPFPFNPAISFPPSGTCTAYTLFGDLLSGDRLSGLLPTSAAFDFGAMLKLTGPNGSQTITTTPGFNGSYIGGAVSNDILSSSLFLDPGSYTVQGFGGANVGSFSTTFTIPQPFVWTGKTQLGAIARSRPLTISWTGGDPAQVVAIIGFGEDLPTNSSAVFACIAPPGANSFTIPADILSNLPATRLNPLESKDVIYVMSAAPGSVQPINASGLNPGSTGFVLLNGKTVAYQ